ncbi:hypothetical protein BB934_37140 (plasmid) [Microvirga ossetica]|uniref:Uncharacterized protein n=1 Tax=Microvirga ossetica TaxID=1882682 RepID=A0A1B2EV49_9HYPH|nr:hypothetical protein BB934_37140 [Microvirga ossetica]
MRATGLQIRLAHLSAWRDVLLPIVEVEEAYYYAVEERRNAAVRLAELYQYALTVCGLDPWGSRNCCAGN